MVQDSCTSTKCQTEPELHIYPKQSIGGVFVTCMDLKLCLKSPTPRCRIVKIYGSYNCPPNHNSHCWFIGNLNMMMEDHLLNVEYINRKRFKGKISNTHSSPIYCVPLNPLFSIGVSSWLQDYAVCCREVSRYSLFSDAPRSTIFLCSAVSLISADHTGIPGASADHPDI
jgi:hypothetical protein